MWQILVVEDDPAFRAALESQVARPLSGRAEFVYTSDIASARQILAAEPPAALLLDICLPLTAGARPDPRGGIKLLAELPAVAPGVAVTILSGQDRQLAVELLLTRRVDGYLFKDGGVGEVLVYLERFLDALDLKRSHRMLKEGVDRSASSSMVAVGPAMRELSERASLVAARDTTVLIAGESGTGKEVAARFVHAHSARASGPFVALSCGALPESLAEAELFGAVKGAYTGLDRNREGVMAQARGGTLFLDEIGELPLPLQPKLLRALQERTFRPLGASREERANFRLITATHRDLRTAVVQGTFREDLLFRVAVFALELPPLRERPEDLPALVAHLVERFNREMGRRVRGLSPEAMQLLARHSWPGNVRELTNVIENAFVVETGDLIRPESLPRLVGSGSQESALLDCPSYEEALATFERRYLERALARANGHIGRTADAIGLARRTLQDRMARFGIRIKDRPVGD